MSEHRIVLSVFTLLLFGAGLSAWLLKPEDAILIELEDITPVQSEDIPSTSQLNDIDHMLDGLAAESDRKTKRMADMLEVWGKTIAPITRIIAILSKESPRESIVYLDGLHLYFHPHMIDNYYIDSTPLEAGIGAQVPESIFSNRRFLRAYDYAVNDLSNAEVNSILREEITETFALYQQEFEAMMPILTVDHTTDSSGHRTAAFVGTFSVSLTMEQEPEIPPSLEGYRLKLFALLTIAANVESQPIQAEINRIVDYATEQRDTLYRLHRDKVPNVVMILTDKSLYNRGILVSAYLQSHPGREQELSYSTELWKHKMLARFDSIITNYDAPYRDFEDLATVDMPAKIVKAMPDYIFDEITER